MTDPLLVPMHLDAMVLNQEASVATPFLRGEPDYSALADFAAVGPPPFGGGSPVPPPAGIYLHWTLPRPLRHATQDLGGPAQFPLVPNRWVVVRVQAGLDPQKAVKAWVLESDAVHEDPDAGSAYVNPHALDSDGMPLPVRIGSSRRLDSRLESLSESGPPFLRAVGPGSATFAIFAPSVNDVFAFTDDVSDVDDVPLAKATFTYHVTGWYSDPTFDPLAKATWTKSPAGASTDDTFGFLAYLGGAPAPTSMLVHALVSGVPWDRAADSPPAPSYPTDVPKTVRVAVGNTAVDALSALVRLDRGNQTEADLLEAFQYGLLDDLDEPGAAERLDNAVRRHWFSAAPGGTGWRVVAAERSAGTQPSTQPHLSPQQQAALVALSRAQREYDRLNRVLVSMRRQLYSLWWKAGWLNASPPSDSSAWMEQQLDVQLGNASPAPGGVIPYLTQVTTQAAAVTGAQAEVDRTRHALSALLDPKQLVLDSGPLPEYHAANDPVVLVTGLGRSTNLDPVGDLTCRLPSQVVATLLVDGKTGTAAPLLDPLGLLPAGIGLLHAESLFLSPALFAQDVLGDIAKAGDVLKAIAALPPPGPTVRFAPAAGSAVEWIQPWVPLLLDWQVTVLKEPAYSGGPTTGPKSPVCTLEQGYWKFDGTDHQWVGPTAATGVDFNEVDSGQMTLTGRTFVTPQLNFTLAAQLDEWVHKHSVSDPKVEAMLKDLDTYLDGIRGQDILSQRLSGLRAQFLQRDGGATARPTGAVADALGEQPQHGFPVPFPDQVNPPIWDFAPLAGTFFTIDRLTVIDFMGRTVDLTLANWSQDPQTGRTSGEYFYPIPATDLHASTDVDPSPSRGISANPTQRMLQLRPRFSQDAQLALRLAAGDGTDEEVDPTAGAAAVCGWVVPNHLDRSIAVYDPDGTACGELFLSHHANGTYVPNWQPDPTDPSAPQTVGAIKNRYLREMLQALVGRNDAGTGFYDLLKVIDETLWAVDPGGAGTDKDLAVLVGRPLAVVRAAISLRLHGLAATSEDWGTTFTSTSGASDVPVPLGAIDGGVTGMTWPVRLGSRALREDGLIGYFTDDAYDTLHAVHVPADVHTPYISQIGVADDYLHLRPIDDSVTAPDPSLDQLHRLTMLVDPRASVHAYSGVLPVTSVQLAPSSVKPALRQMAYLFRAGPLLTPPDAIRMPRPAGHSGTWSWFDHVGGDAVPVAPADGKARVGSTPPLAREGWLKLVPNADPDSLTEET